MTGQSKKLKVLDGWDEGDVDAFLESLLKSRTALDATQIDSLQKLLAARPLPAVDVGMKETLVVVIDHLIKLDRADEAQRYFTSPTDVLRYLWYKHTGFLQIVAPATIIKRHKLNAVHEFRRLDGREPAKRKAKAALVLKYGRRESHRVARWLDAIDLPASSSAEIMHPLREMWVRFIRALRLAEYARRPGFERLKSLLDVFYREAYDVWQGKVDEARLRGDLAHQPRCCSSGRGCSRERSSRACSGRGPRRRYEPLPRSWTACLPGWSSRSPCTRPSISTGLRPESSSRSAVSPRRSPSILCCSSVASRSSRR